MSLGTFNAVQHPTQPIHLLPSYKLRQLGLFWLSFCSGLMLLALLLMRPYSDAASASSPQRPADNGNHAAMFDLNLGETATPPPLPTLEPTITPGAGTIVPTEPPTITPEPPKPSATPTDKPPTPVPTNTDVPVPTNTPAPPPTIIPTTVPEPTDTPTVVPPSVTPVPPTATLPPTVRPSDTPGPTATKPTATLVPSPPTPTPPTPQVPSATPVPTKSPTPKPGPTTKPTDPPQPQPTAQPTAIDTLVPTSTPKPIAPTATATRRILTRTPTTPAQPSSTPNVTVTPQSEPDATATTTSEQVVVVPPLPANTATPEPTPTSALTEFIADNPTGPILIYTYTQRLKPDGNHLVAACVLNIGDAPASNVEAAFDATSPAVITGLRIPSELSSRGATRATVRIATLSPKFMKQLEVSIGSVEIPMPEWISVTITRAYALNHPGDPAFPEKCEPEGVDAVSSDVKEVSLMVGPYSQILANAEELRQSTRTIISINNPEVGPAISLSILQCVVGWIAFCFAILLLLVIVRRRRRQQLQIANP